MSAQTQYDVVIFGATGFTGRQCAKFLNQHPTKPRWAIAGRSQSRLDALRKDLGLPSSVGTVVAEVTNEQSIRDMFRSCKAVVNVVGPFKRLGGETLAKICAEEGKGLVDLSGESGYNRDLNRFHDLAIKNGAIIAPSVGFDTMPFDLGAHLAVQELKKQGVEPRDISVDCSAAIVGGISGGTINSAMDMADQNRRQMQNVDADMLSPIKGGHKYPWAFPHWSKTFRAYGIWLPFTPHNHRVVYRAHGLLEQTKSSERYGPNFKFRDSFIVAPALKFWIVAAIVSLIVNFNTSAMVYLWPVRALLRRIIPANWGPSQKALENGSMDVRSVASSQGKSAITVIRGRGDPGYTLTAWMINEAALLIAQDRDKLPAGGVLTSATLNAEVLAERLTKNTPIEVFSQPWREGERIPALKRVKGQ